MKRLPMIVFTLGVLLALTFQAVHAQQGSHTVAILIVDDFTGVDLSTVQVPANQESCAVSLEGQAFITRGASAGSDQPITEPHGELVYSQLEDMVTQLQADSFIQLVKVDIKGNSSDAIVQAIEQAMTDQPADMYVVNMSFSLIPCQFVKNFADFEKQLGNARKAKDKNKYSGALQQAAAYYDQYVFPTNFKKFQKQQTGLDALQDFFAAHTDTIIPIASAGNFGLDYPMWPAAWSQVVSVSGSAGEGFESSSSWDKKTDQPLLGADTQQKGKKGTRISNYGTVMLPGEYTTTDYGVVLGTSFSAPRLSMVMALYLSGVGNAFCRRSDGAAALALSDWKNLTLSQAVAQYCPDMQSYLLQ